MVQPVADEILSDLLSDALPEFVGDYSYRLGLEDLAWTEAQCRILRSHINDMGLEAAMTDEITVAEDETDVGEGRRKRMSTTRRINAALEQLRRCQAHARQLRNDLGLTPSSRAKLGRDVAQATGMSLAEYWQYVDPIPDDNPPTGTKETETADGLP